MLEKKKKKKEPKFTVSYKSHVLFHCLTQRCLLRKMLLDFKTCIWMVKRDFVSELEHGLQSPSALDEGRRSRREVSLPCLTVLGVKEWVLIAGAVARPATFHHYQTCQS